MFRLFRKQHSQPSYPPFVSGLIKALETGPIGWKPDSYYDFSGYPKLDPHGISCLPVKVGDIEVIVSWWRDGSMMEITIDGQSFPYPEDHLVRAVLDAAQARARCLLRERFAELDSKVEASENESCEETDYLLKSKANAEALRLSQEEYKAGDFVEYENDETPKQYAH